MLVVDIAIFLSVNTIKNIMEVDGSKRHKLTHLAPKLVLARSVSINSIAIVQDFIPQGSLANLRRAELHNSFWRHIAIAQSLQ